MSESAPRPAGLWRRLGAVIYDALLVLALWLVAAALLLPLTGGEPVRPGHPLVTLYFLGVAFAFFGWFWTRGGQTAGMRAWRIRLQRADGGPVSWAQALARFVTALPAWSLFVFGLLRATTGAAFHLRPPLDLLLRPAPGILLALGAAWVIYECSPWTWRDGLTRTRVVCVPRPSQAQA